MAQQKIKLKRYKKRSITFCTLAEKYQKASEKAGAFLSYRKVLPIR